jgi:hypothetical protein
MAASSAISPQAGHAQPRMLPSGLILGLTPATMNILGPSSSTKHPPVAAGAPFSAKGKVKKRSEARAFSFQLYHIRAKNHSFFSLDAINRAFTATLMVEK